MWEVLSVEAETLPPELEGIAGDYGHVAESFSLSRRGHPDTKINLLAGRVAAITRSGVRYELSPTTEPSAYAVLVNGRTYIIHIYYYCQGPRPKMPQNARNMACPIMLTEKVPCSFSCDTGFELSEPSLLVGSLACTASGKFTANSSCVRVGEPPIAQISSAPTAQSDTSDSSAPVSKTPEVSVPRPEASASIAQPTVAAKGSRARTVLAIAILLALAVGVAIYFLAKRRRR